MIHRLSEDTIRKIAAGEVIERPASVVKELVENSIDAGATRIQVEIRGGGKQSIRVTDDGQGIAADDFVLAFERHATSKIEQFDDLYRVHSLGFRGEALASIVAVAKVEAKSRTRDAAVGTHLQWEDSQLRSCSELAMPVGTEMEVHELFYNVPVRQRFLKSDTTEGNRISMLLYSLAIGNPSISMTFTRDERRVFHTRADYSLAQNLLLLFGRAYHDALLPIDVSQGIYRIHGFLGNNTFYRGNRQMQFFYVNGRFIEEETLRAAIEDKYRSIIPHGRFPAFQLFIETDPGNIDINIHPNKQKIQFHQAEELTALLQQAVEAALHAHPDLPGAVAEPSAASADLSKPGGYEAVLARYREEFPGLSDTSIAQQRAERIQKAMESLTGASAVEEASDPQPEWIRLEEIDETEPEEAEFIQSDLSTEEDASAPVVQASFSEPTPAQSLLPPAQRLRYLGTLFRTYLLFEEPAAGQCFLLDQHAAHERINYERFTKQFRRRTVVSQQLAPPLRLHLRDSQRQALSDREEVLRALGFDFSLFGEQELALRAVPTLFHSPEDAQLFYDLLDLEISDLSTMDAIADRLATRACRASVKQGDLLPEAQVWALYQDLGACEYPLTCPHGRPTILRRTRADLEKLFLRIK